jgi:peptide chain release factor 2
MRMLQAKLAQIQAEKLAQEKQGLKGEYKLASWGNQIRNYVLQPYQLVKDLRSGVETGNASAVLDGDIQQFIDAGVKLV